MSERKLHIMQLVSDLEIGGAQQVVRTLAENFQRLGHIPLVVAFHDGPLRAEIEAAGIPVEIVRGRRYGALALPLFLAEWLRIRRDLLHLVHRYQIDVIQTHILHSLDFLTLTLRRRDGLPLIFWTVQNANFTLRAEHLSPRMRFLLGPKRLAHRLLYWLCAKAVDGFIAVSDEVRAAILREIGPIDEKITVICNAVDFSRYQPVDGRVALRERLGFSNQETLAAVVATFKEQKGHRYLIEAARQAVPTRSDLHLLFIGDGALREDLQQRVHAAGLEDHIHFLGLRNDVPDLLAASDLFVLPSLWEGLSMALVEAMSAGLPIVATAVSGTTQVILPGETGLIVPPGDSAALAAAITGLLAAPERARQMAAAGRSRVEALFGAAAQAEQCLRLYRRHLPRRPAS